MMLDDIWQPLRYFEGNWTGTGRGEPGKGFELYTESRLKWAK